MNEQRKPITRTNKQPLIFRHPRVFIRCCCCFCFCFCCFGWWPIERSTDRLNESLICGTWLRYDSSMVQVRTIAQTEPMPVFCCKRLTILPQYMYLPFLCDLIRLWADDLSFQSLKLKFVSANFQNHRIRTEMMVPKSMRTWSVPLLFSYCFQQANCCCVLGAITSLRRVWFWKLILSRLELIVSLTHNQ